MLIRTTRRPRERGQVLVLALAYFALLALLGGATLQLMSTQQLQHVADEAQTSQRALIEGAATLAFSDLSRPGSTACTGGASPSGVVPGSATTPLNEVLGYTVKACYPGGSNPTGNSGLSCFLCVLTSTSGQTVFAANKGVVTVTAPSGTPSSQLNAVINSNVSFAGGGGDICSQLPTDPAGTCSLQVGVAGTTYPNPLQQGAGNNGSTVKPLLAISDPFASVFQPPNLGALTAQPSPCGGTLTAGGACGAGATASQGIYTAINISNGTLTLSPGIYVITEGFEVSGHGNITGSGVTIYMGCNTGGVSPTAAPCSPPASPATSSSAGSTCSPASPVGVQSFASLGGNGTITLTAPTSGEYAGLVLFADPNNAASVCTSGSGTGSLSLNGAVYGKSYGLDIGGNGIASIVSNLVIGAINIHVSSLANGLKLGTGGSISPLSCELYDASLVARASPSGPQYHGRIVFQTQCPLAGGPSIIAISYSQ